LIQMELLKHHFFVSNKRKIYYIHHWRHSGMNGGKVEGFSTTWQILLRIDGGKQKHKKKGGKFFLEKAITITIFRKCWNMKTEKNFRDNDFANFKKKILLISDKLKWWKTFWEKQEFFIMSVKRCFMAVKDVGRSREICGFLN
jgi:hypothetical protein